jgi:hypothetical protein
VTRFYVITSIPNGDGNLAHELDVWRDDENGDPQKVSLDEMLDLKLRTRVFELGEILVCAPGGREVGGAERKPSKWRVGYAEFEDVEDAIACSRRIRDPLDVSA